MAAHWHTRNLRFGPGRFLTSSALTHRNGSTMVRLISIRHTRTARDKARWARTCESRTDPDPLGLPRLDRSSSNGHFLSMDYRSIITIEPGKRSGKPCIRGMRITVTDVLEYLAGGMSIPEILADFPELTEEDIRACLAFAADRERRLAVIGG